MALRAPCGATKCNNSKKHLKHFEVCPMVGYYPRPQTSFLTPHSFNSIESVSWDEFKTINYCESFGLSERLLGVDTITIIKSNSTQHSTVTGELRVSAEDS